MVKPKYDHFTSAISCDDCPAITNTLGRKCPGKDKTSWSSCVIHWRFLFGPKWFLFSAPASFTLLLQQFDMTWQRFWEFMEGYVATFIASIIAFRSFFTGQSTRDRNMRRWIPSASWMERAKYRRNQRNEKSDVRKRDQLPSIPRALLTGMTTYIQAHRRSIE